MYGPEDYPFVEYLPMQPVNRQVAMPIFGLKYPDGAFLGVITEGEFDAKVVAAPSGYIVDYYRTNAKFVVRREFLAPLRRDTTVHGRELGGSAPTGRSATTSSRVAGELRRDGAQIPGASGRRRWGFRRAG